MPQRFPHELQAAGFLITVIGFNNALDGFAHRIDQFAAAHFARLNACADDMFDMQCLTPLDIGHHALPLLQILLHQPIDQALDLVFDLLRNVCQHLLLELGSYFVTPHQFLDIGETQSSIEEIEPALLEFVQDVLHFCQARVELALKVALIVFDGCFQSRGSFLVLFQILRLRLCGFGSLCNQIFCHAQRVVELELQARRVVQCGGDVTVQIVESAGRPSSGSAAQSPVQTGRAGLTWPKPGRTRAGLLKQWWHA